MTKTFKQLREINLNTALLKPRADQIRKQATAGKWDGQDKKDFETAAKFLDKGDLKGFSKFIHTLDTFPKDEILHSAGLWNTKLPENVNHVGQNVSQKLSYDNWLKKVKGIEKGAHGIKGDEHTKLSKQWKDYRGKDKLAASYEQVELKEVSPPGWGGSVKAMKKHADIDNPYALAWHMKNKGDKPHYKDKDGTPVKKDKYKDEQMEQVTEKLDVKWDKDKEGWFDKQGKRRYLGKGATTDLMRKAIDKAKKTGDWIKPFDLQHGQRPEEREIEMKKETLVKVKTGNINVGIGKGTGQSVSKGTGQSVSASKTKLKAQYETHKYFDTKSGSIEDSIKQMYQLESTEVTIKEKEIDDLVKQYIAKGGTITKLPPGLKPGEDPDPERKAYKVKKVAGGWKILKASLREFIRIYNEHFLTNYAAEEFIEDMQHGYDSQGKSLAPKKEKEEGAMKRGKHLDTYKPKPKDK